MAKAKYYFDNGRGGLTEVPVEADDKGNLIRLDDDGKPTELGDDGKPVAFCRGAKKSDNHEPADGRYILDSDRKKKKKGGKSEESEPPAEDPSAPPAPPEP